MRAYVLVTNRPGTSEELLPKLKETRSLKGLVSADSVFGRYEARYPDHNLGTRLSDPTCIFS